MPTTLTDTQTVVFRLARTADGSGEYWTPTIAGGADTLAVKLLSDMGHPTDTDGWEDPPTRFRGWYDPESIGAIVHDLTRAGFNVLFSHTPLKDETQGA